MSTESKPLGELVARIIETRRREIRINPTWVATEAMLELDPLRHAPPLVYLGCHLELRQIARGMCRGMFEPEAAFAEEAAHSLFPELQWRYPTPKRDGEEPTYVLLEGLTAPEIDFNVARLRNEAEAKLRHADALEGWARTTRRRAS